MFQPSEIARIVLILWVADRCVKLGRRVHDVRGGVMPMLMLFRQALFARVVPNVKRLGLLTPYVRKAFMEMGILQFEDQDPEALDRALGLL